MPYIRTLQACFAVVLLFALGVSDARAQTQSQGWTDWQRRLWHNTGQGSRLIPSIWLRSLEQPDSEQLFLDDAYIASLRYLPQPGQLPLGFIEDRQDHSSLSRTQLRWRNNQDPRTPWVGLTCAACHTGELTYQGRAMRIEGGPTLADFQGFMESLLRALQQTQNERARWVRFANRVLGPAADDRMLRGAVGTYVDWLTNYQRMSDTPGMRYGFGRLDAFGHIFNQVADLADPGRAHGNPPDAPVSYPFLWNIHRLTHVQYNAIAPNRILGIPGAGALGRNTGEVIGVFADVVVPIEPRLLTFVSSADVPKLLALEAVLTQLQPPRWPANLPPIDAAAARRGAALFGQHCASCHLPMTTVGRIPLRLSTFNDASNPSSDNAPANRQPGTDIWMACNAVTYTAMTARLRGLPPFLSAEQDSLAAMLKLMVIGTVLGSPRARGDAFLRTLLGQSLPDAYRVPAEPPRTVAALPDRAIRREHCMSARDSLLGYKSRPLDGIWATGPFLHNGSVPNLYELLLPPARRSTSFPIGTREFDPLNVGFSIARDAPGNTQTFRVVDEQGQQIPGNSNEGHDYNNADFTDPQRRDLIEYMKQL